MLFARCARCLGQEDAVERLRRESCMGIDSAMDTVRLHSRGSCDSGVDMGQDNKGLTLNEDDGQNNQRLRVPAVRLKSHLRVPLEEENETEESDDEVWSRPGPSHLPSGVHVRVELHRESSEDESHLNHSDSIPLLTVVPRRVRD